MHILEIKSQTLGSSVIESMNVVSEKVKDGLLERPWQMMAGIRHRANTSSTLFSNINWHPFGTLLGGQLVAQSRPIAGWDNGHFILSLCGSLSHSSTAKFDTRCHIRQKCQHFLAKTHQLSCEQLSCVLVNFLPLDFPFTYRYHESQHLSSYALLSQ